MVPEDTLNQIRERFQFLEAKMAGGAEAGEIADLAREYAELKPVVAEIEAYRAMLASRAEAEAMLDDAEMKALAEEELVALKSRLPNIEQNLRLALL
ncbi:MAG: PCRF domain-containing protein, partial [Silicimonas sp.]|nr:PCRF domain-containing protein [Silicimonas sp.]